MKFSIRALMALMLLVGVAARYFTQERNLEAIRGEVDAQIAAKAESIPKVGAAWRDPQTLTVVEPEEKIACWSALIEKEIEIVNAVASFQEQRMDMYEKAIKHLTAIAIADVPLRIKNSESVWVRAIEMPAGLTDSFPDKAYRWIVSIPQDANVKLKFVISSKSGSELSLNGKDISGEATVEAPEIVEVPLLAGASEICLKTNWFQARYRDRMVGYYLPGYRLPGYSSFKGISTSTLSHALRNIDQDKTAGDNFPFKRTSALTILLNQDETLQLEGDLSGAKGRDYSYPPIFVWQEIAASNEKVVSMRDSHFERSDGSIRSDTSRRQRFVQTDALTNAISASLFDIETEHVSISIQVTSEMRDESIDEK